MCARVGACGHVRDRVFMCACIHVCVRVAELTTLPSPGERLGFGFPKIGRNEASISSRCRPLHGFGHGGVGAEDAREKRAGGAGAVRRGTGRVKTPCTLHRRDMRTHRHRHAHARTPLTPSRPPQPLHPPHRRTNTHTNTRPHTPTCRIQSTRRSSISYNQRT